ncbi:MAG TPA: SDR family NAD(P)-dependent oxidoreductase [Steroidobacteraceae bacterium]|nr:SDR family NAD(P)-dependent oxidoreductase [Steroidobacteraceae bacterium]HRX89710.1 SDR family NAD(P)-dependent oxidoreductase [Steroidobacteraceae bacterium]
MAEPRKPLLGRHALVSGASRGIGEAIVRALADAGASITLLGRQRAGLKSVAASLGDVRSSCQVADVCDPAAVRAAVTGARDALGPIHILINNAGQAASAPLAKTDDALWQAMLAVNLTGSFLLMRECLPDMVAGKFGRIVNVASTAGLKGYGYVAAYCAAKHGVIGLTRAAALEHARRGITVNAVCPGYTDTDIVQSSIDNISAKTGRSKAEALAELVAVNPQGRLIQPAEVASAVLWLCSAGAESVTGQSIAVAGGEVT